MDLEQARINMIKQQLRTCEVLDNTLLSLLNELPRDRFVPSQVKNLAFADMQLPIGHEQIMFSPKEEAQMLQSLALKPTDRVLEIGTGTGYITALLAKLCQHVTSVDLFADFTRQAQMQLQQLEIENVTFGTGNAASGWANNAPYDVILLSGSLAKLPQALSRQLNPAGRIFAILGQAPAMQACVLTQTQPNQWQTTPLFETVVPRLLKITEPSSFVF
jgi:protein-L-isoaspartate(D-aspartate) O-methyltransferase